MSPGGRSDRERVLLLATHSRHKLEELRRLLRLERARLVDLAELGITVDAIEDAPTFRGNAIGKARFYAGLSGLPTLADDSGLEVDALGGRPGVHTRRYAGEDPTDAENNAKLLAELEGVPPARRGARYRCVLAFYDPDDRRTRDGERRWVTTRSAAFPGRIALAPRGSAGFGYDPVFEPASEPLGGRTVGELRAEEKDVLSHRARAARAMARYLRSIGY